MEKTHKFKLFTSCFFSILFLFIVFSSATQAQLSMLSPGERIRITAPKNFVQPVIGEFSKVLKDSVCFTMGSKIFVVPFQNIEKIEVRRGHHRNAKKGAIIGAITGGFSLGLIAYSDASKSKDGWEIISPGNAFTGGFLTGAVVGGGLGAIIGKGIRSEKWVTLKIE